MYGWLWRNLPGPTWVRAVLAVVLAVSVAVLLFLVVFPVAERHIPFLRVTVDDQAGVVVGVSGTRSRQPGPLRR
jgi:hypothetical protein